MKESRPVIPALYIVFAGPDHFYQFPRIACQQVFKSVISFLKPELFVAPIQDFQLFGLFSPPQRAKDSGNWHSDTMTKEEFFQLLNERINSVPIRQVKEDVLPFIKDYRKLDIWSRDYFRDIAKMISFV